VKSEALPENVLRIARLVTSQLEVDGTVLPKMVPESALLGLA